MNVQQSLPLLRETARRILPGLRHLQAQLDITVRVLTYIESQTESTADPALIEAAEEMQSLFSAFNRIQSRAA